MRAFSRLVSVGVACGLLVACGQDVDQNAPPFLSDADTGYVPTKTVSAAVAKAVQNELRPGKDLVDDRLRRPAFVLEFAGILPGMQVLEIEAGDGYYTQILGPLVGPEGRVLAHNPSAFKSFLGGNIEARVARGGLDNVVPLMSAFDTYNAADESIDVATWILGPHEIYYRPLGAQEGLEADAVFAEIFRVLKPGGAFVVLDHAAKPGAPTSVGGTLHRIDPQIVHELARGAGFIKIEESTLLANPNDDRSRGVFDPRIRRMTDRFLVKYHKPFRQNDVEQLAE